MTDQLIDEPYGPDLVKLTPLKNMGESDVGASQHSRKLIPAVNASPSLHRQLNNLSCAPATSSG